MPEEEQSRYFQEIAKRFLTLRGAPFFLSAKDLDLISFWEQAGVPLSVVLEGIEKAFDKTRPGTKRRDKTPTLSFCEAWVARVFEQHRDRNVGKARKTTALRDKKTVIRSEIEKFLERLPPEAGFLKDIYIEAKGKLAGRGVPDEEIERLDKDVENLLLATAAAAERAAVGKEIRAEDKRLSREEWTAAVDIKLVKRLRDKYKIPYLSPFYY